MAKWKEILFAKAKKVNSEPVSEKKHFDYLQNIVPPVNNNNFSNNETGEINNVEIATSAVIPLHEQNNAFPGYENNYFQQNNNQGNGINSLISFKDTFKIPKPISFEIKIEKLKQLFLALFAFIVLSVGILFITLYFKNINLQYIPHPVITIPLVIVSSAIFLINLIDFFALKREVNLYIDKTLKGSLLPPIFIIRNYRKIHARKIIFNWIFIVSYIILGLIDLILFLISGQKITFLVQKWTVQVPYLYQDGITLAIILAILLTIHMATLVIFRKRKSNILSYYGYEIINPVDLETYKKKVNRICMIITFAFLAIIFFAIVIPILIVKRRKKSK